MDQTVDLQLQGEPIALPTDEALDAAGAALGTALPPSYRAFVKRYGFGLSAGLFMIYVPAPPGYTGRSQNLVDTSRVLSRELREALAHGWIRFEPDGSEEIVRRLIPFAYSENGDRLAWDPADPTGEGEFAIYAIGEGYDPITRAAPHLVGFFEKALAPGMGGILGRANFTLEPTFKPWKMFVD